MRLIDADSIPWLVEGVGDIPVITKEEIDEMPTVEAVPIRHGKWNCSDDIFEYAICSACKWDSGEAWEYAKKNFIYCPNCGAKMDDGKANADS